MSNKLKNKKNGIEKMESTHDRFLKSLSEKQRAEYDREYKKLLLSEMRLALKQNNKIFARKLARAAGVSIDHFSNTSAKKN
jgi:hypothetical protein